MRLIKMVFLGWMVIISSLPVYPQKSSSFQDCNKYIEALITATNLHTVYSDDGAGDATLTERPAPEVVRILDLGARAVPLLIAHLDDMRSTNVMFMGRDRKQRRVAVGHLCLDILTSIVEAREVLVGDCADDGLGACVQEGYYFRPDEISLAAFKEVEANWKKLYKSGGVKYNLVKVATIKRRI